MSKSLVYQKELCRLSNFECCWSWNSFQCKSQCKTLWWMSGRKILPVRLKPFIYCAPCSRLVSTTPVSFSRVSLPNVLCGAMLGVAVGCVRFTVSSPWQHAEKSSCLLFHRYPGGEKINRLRIRCPRSHPSLCWPWPLPRSKRQTIPVVIKRSLKETSAHGNTCCLLI